MRCGQAIWQGFARRRRLECTCRQGLWVLRFLYSCAKYSKKRNGLDVVNKQRKQIYLHFSTLVVYSCVNCNATQVENEMTRFTEKTIRTANQWMKVTRDNKERTFTFARGYTGQFTANEIQTLSFKWVANWTEALEKANRTLSTYA